MSDTGSSGDNKPQQQDEANLVSPSAVAAAATTAAVVPEVENKPVTPAKRTPSKRISAVERAQRESEELVKTMGGSLDIEGGRKTRSSTRGTPSRSNVVDTPPPTKKSKASGGTPRRGRGRKLDTAIEAEVKSPEKISAESEPAKEDEGENSVVDAAKTEEKATLGADDTKVENETSGASVEEENATEKQSPAKEVEKPEPMEVDGISKEEINTPIESEPASESALVVTETSENTHEDPPPVANKESDKPATEQKESSSVVEEVPSAGVTAAEATEAPPAATPMALGVEKTNSVVENKVVENSVGNNVEINNSDGKTISLSSDICPPPAAPPVSVAGNDHKAESNDFCEPKIASPPITANNDGATPQYCN